MQLPQHSDRAPCYQRMRTPKPCGHVTQAPRRARLKAKGNCGRARAAPSRHATIGHVSGTTARRSLGFRRQQEPRRTCWQAAHLHVTRQAPWGLRQHKPLKRGHPTRRASTGGGGLPQTHPAALRSGMQMGFETPEQQHPLHIPTRAEEDASSE